jgi:N-acetylneuraminic acid mutarotase
MKRFFLPFLAAAALCSFAQENLAPLPVPVTDNAVVSVRVDGQYLVYSFGGLGAKKSWDSVTNAAYALNLRYNKWTTVRAIPGTGRVAAAAVAVTDEIFLLGGFVPDQSGLQAVVSDVSVYDPIGLRWYRGPDLPTAVRDAGAGVYRDRYIYVVGGFSKKGPVNVVQLYDTVGKQWSQATPYPGAAVFGLAATVVGDNIVYMDGARASGAPTGARYVASDECWIGKIDRHDPKKIEWSKLPPHPGSARYRIAASGSDREQKAYFAGGSAEVFDYNGIGLDGKPAEPSPTVFAYNLRRNAWEIILEKDPNPTLDHHGLGVVSDGLVVVGGMGKEQKVVSTVRMLPKGK